MSFTVTPAIGALSPPAGPEGATVVIGGTSFGAMQGTSTVTFNGTAATATSWSATSITVTVPTGATSGSVVVTVGGQASNGVTFTVGTDPVVTSLSPALGQVGTTVVIGGANFGASQGTGTVTFNGVAAAATSWSATSIAVTVPAAAATGPVVVTVGGEVSNQVTFTVTGPPPVINKLKPADGGIGDSVKVKGEHFGTAQGTSTVTFNGLDAVARKWVDDKITVNVPAGARTGPVVVTVEGQASNPVTFTVTGSSPSIMSLDPTSGGVGTPVTINGVHFGAAQGTGTVTFNGVTATPTSWSDSAITVPVPATAGTGPVVVTVGGQASNGVTFTVTGPPPSISELNPPSGPVGASVVISGADFGAAQGTGTVTFNGALVETYTSWSETSITLTVPADATSGSVVVTVGGQTSNSLTFTVVIRASIGSLNPDKGTEGTPVTIEGANFGDSQGTSTVTFNGVAAAATSWSATSITAAVPAGATTGDVVVTVGGHASEGASFTVKPAISSLSPDSGPVGTAVDIGGTSFGASQETSTVTFNGTAATATSWSATSVTVAVPAGATTGDVVVTVGGEASDGVEFTVTPAISSLSPDKGPEGTTVVIAGTSFGTTQGTSTVSFNGTAATASSWSATSITVAVPAGVTTGDVVVTVDGEASNGVAFTVTPAISSLSPDTGPVGTSVVIAGTSFGGTQGTSTVTFNGLSATASSWSATSITAAVPAGATTGPVVVTVGGEASDGVEFTVTPAIGSLSPDTGSEGTSVVIAGTSFRATQGASTLAFNGVAATASSWSDTSITAAVPAGATTGPVVVTVDSQTSNGVAFTVTPAIGSLSPDTGPVETTVEITGTSFGATQGTGTVTFNGIAATASSWSDTSITAVVPAGATTGPVVVTVDGEASNGVTFTVRENRAPEVEQTIPAQTVNKGASVDLTVSSYFSDPDGDDLEYTVSSTDTAKVTVAVSGAVVTLTGVAQGDATVTVTASDGSLTAQQAFTVTVPNGAPARVGSVSAQTVNKGASVDLTVSSYFSDPDGDDLEYTASSSDTAKVTIAVSGAVVTLTGVAKGDATVTVTASDGSLAAQQAFTVTVPNRAPEAVGTIGAQTVNKGSNVPVTVSGNFRDPDMDSLAYSASSSDTSKVSVSVSGAVVTATGVAQGSATVTVTASDGSLTAQQVFTVTVPNRAPVKVGDVSAQQVHKKSSKDVSVSGKFSDADMDSLSYSARSLDTSKVTVSVSGSTVTITGVSQTSSSVTVRVTASDGHGGSTTLDFGVTVPNRAPVKVGNVSAQQVHKKSSKGVSVSGKFSDADMDSLSYSARSLDTSKVTVSVSGSTVTITGVSQTSSSVTVRVTASDGHGGSATLDFGVTVPNRRPTCSGISDQEVYKGASKNLNLSSYFSDADMDSLSYSASSNSSDVDVSVSGSSLTIEGESQGSGTVMVTANDGHGGTRKCSFNVTVPNRSPVVDQQISPQSVYKGESETLNLSSYFSDPDMDMLEYSASSSNTSKVDVEMSGSKVTLSGVSQGSATVTVTASDGDLTAEQRFKVTVPNRLPPFSSIPAQTVNKGDSEDLNLADPCSNDPDGDTLTYMATSSDTSVVNVSVNGSTLTITGVGQGSTSVTVTCKDGHGGNPEQSFGVTVPNRPPPSSTIPAQTVTKGSSKQLTLSTYFSDPDMDTLTYMASSSASSKATASVSGSTLTITGVAQGSAEVTVTASDGHGGTATESFSVTVTVPTPATPSISSISPGLQPPDTEVTISGSNFGSSEGSVSFGSDSVTDISSWSNTSIRCFVPAFASAGTVSVTVTTSGGQTSSGYSYTITGQPVRRGECGDGEDCPGDEKLKKGGSGGGSEESEDPPGDGG